MLERHKNIYIEVYISRCFSREVRLAVSHLWRCFLQWSTPWSSSQKKWGVAKHLLTLHSMAKCIYILRTILSRSAKGIFLTKELFKFNQVFTEWHLCCLRIPVNWQCYTWQCICEPDKIERLWPTIALGKTQELWFCLASWWCVDL